MYLAVSMWSAPKKAACQGILVKRLIGCCGLTQTGGV
jgi:hypothetical protein